MKRAAWWIVAAVVVVAVIAVGWWGYRQAKDFEALARAGKADASAALKSLEGGDTAAALAGFDKARDEFSRARDLLGPSWLRGTWWLGDQLDAADDLATIGVEGSTAGAEGVRLLDEASAVTGPDRLGRLLTLARPRLDASLTSLTVVADRYDRLSADGLVGPLAEAVTDARDRLAPLRPLLARSDALLGLERYLYSGQHRFILLAQNNAQLRPTGGLPGTYGLVEIGPDGLRLDTFADIYTLPNDTLNLPIPDGRQVNSRHLFFRAAGWWMDFPTSADVMLRLWGSMDQPQVDGIIAIDLPTIRDLLKVFGPIRVPESDTAFTAENLIERLNYVVQVELSGQGLDGKKTAVVSLARTVMERLLRLGDDEFLPTMESLASSANDKHIQLYVTDPDAQADLVAAGWSGALNPPADTTDLLAVSNAVIAPPAKGNLDVAKALDYAVTLNDDGSADTRLTLDYRKSARNVLGRFNTQFSNYVRVHRAVGTTRTGGAVDESLTDATGLPTFARSLDVGLGEHVTTDLRTHVPDAVRAGAAAPVPGLSGPVPDATAAWHYRLVVARQADLVDTGLSVSVQVPKGWTVVASTAWLRNSGEVLPTTVADDRVTLATPLSQDVLLDITLRRP